VHIGTVFTQKPGAGSMGRLLVTSPRLDPGLISALAHGLIVAGLIVVLLIAGREILEPLVIAALLAFILSPLIRRLRQWGVWRAGGIGVPLAVSHPPAELEYAIGDADAAVVVAHPNFAETLRLSGRIDTLLARPAAANGAVAIATVVVAPGDDSLPNGRSPDSANTAIAKTANTAPAM